jgi:hypothetical protein
VIGHGIAVVEQVDSKEIHVALGNRLVLRIARKKIVLNRQNMRWERAVNHARNGETASANRPTSGNAR